MNPDDRRIVFEGVQFDVVLERWGGTERELAVHPGSVAVLALDAERRVVLVRQFREAAGKVLLELPAGKLEHGEEPLDAARRELKEETGYDGGDWRKLATFWTTPGFVREIMHLFLAEGVVPGEPETEDDEDVEVLLCPLAELRESVAELEDAKTMLGVLLLER